MNLTTSQAADYWTCMSVKVEVCAKFEEMFIRTGHTDGHRGIVRTSDCIHIDNIKIS